MKEYPEEIKSIILRIVLEGDDFLSLPDKCEWNDHTIEDIIFLAGRLNEEYNKVKI